MTRKKSLTLFQLTFIGEYCEILTDVVGGPVEGVPLVINGFLLDLDEEYFYIGPSHNEISHAVRRDKVNFISIVDETDEIKEVLKNVPTPKNKDEGN